MGTITTSERDYLCVEGDLEDFQIELDNASKQGYILHSYKVVVHREGVLYIAILERPIGNLEYVIPDGYKRVELPDLAAGSE